MLKLSFDIGNGYSKFVMNEGATVFKEFPTKVCESSSYFANNSLGENIYKVEFEGKNYIVGQGSEILGPERYYKKEYLMCLLTAIALTQFNESLEEINKIDLRLALGVPAGIHNYHQKRLKPYLESLGEQKIIVDEKTFLINIHTAVIVPECSLGNVMPAIRKGHNMIIDIGAGTLDWTEWLNGEVINRDTNVQACNQLYKDIRTNIQNEKGNCFVTVEQIRNVVENKVYTNIIDEEIVFNIFQQYSKTIIQIVFENNHIPFDGIYLIGGGSYSLEDHIKDNIDLIGERPEKVSIIKNCEYTNVLIYQKTLLHVLKSKFGDDN